MNRPLIFGYENKKMELGKDTIGESALNDEKSISEAEQKLKLLIEEEVQLKQVKSELDEREKQIKAEIQYCLDALGVTFFEDSYGNIASVKEVTQQRLNSPKVKAFLGENISEYMKPTTFIQVTVKTKEERERGAKFAK